MSDKDYFMYRQDPDNWYGIFYFCRKDPRLFVPKLNLQLGQTINFANPYAWLFIVMIMIIIFLL
jgi:uncharacterized membrane protein